MINLIWAMDQNRLIGAKDKLPWHYPLDLKHFKTLTNQKRVLMGHETYLSLKGYYKNKSLPFNPIYVANLNDYNYPDAILVKDVISFLANNEEELWVVGGKTIYELSLPYANNLYITYILNHHQGDIYIKPIDLTNYQLTYKEVYPQLIFTKYERIEKL